MSSATLDRINQLAVALLVAAGLALSVGVRVAAADTPDPLDGIFNFDGPPSTPILLSVRAISPTSVMITWRDTADDESWFDLRQVRPPTPEPYWTPWSPSVPSRGGEESRRVGGLLPNTEYCFQLQAVEHGFAKHATSNWSVVMCATTPPEAPTQTPCIICGDNDAPQGGTTPAPPPKPTKPDLQVTRVSGPTALLDGQSAVYEVALWNEGTPATGIAQILLGFLGSVEAQAMVETPAGFMCSRDEFGFSCTGSLGGVDDPIGTRSALFKVRGRAKATGTGTVYGSANHHRALDETTVDNNLQKLSVTVQ